MQRLWLPEGLALMLGAVRRNVAVQMLALALSFSDRFLVVGLLVHVWGADIYAQWALIVSAAGLLQLGELGLNVHYGNVWQKAVATGDRAKADRMLAVALWVGLVQALVLLALAGIAALAVGLPDGPDALAAYALLSLSTVLMVARGSFSQLYRGHGRYARGTLVTLAGNLSMLVATLLAVGFGGGMVAVATSLVACQLVFGLGLPAWDLKRQFPELHWRPARPDRRELRDIGAHVRWLALEQCAPVAWLQLPVLALGLAGVGGTALVAFVMIRTLVNFARQLATMLSIAVGVELAGLSHEAPEVALKRLRQAARLVAAMVSGFAVAIWIFGPATVRVWGGGAIAFDAAVAGWLLAATAACAPAAMLSRYLVFTGDARPSAMAWIVQMAIAAVAMAVFMPAQGAVGAAIALSLAEIAGMGLVLPMLAGPQLGGTLGAYLRGCAFAVLVGGGWCGVVALGLQKLLPAEDAVGLMIVAALWGVLGFAPAMIAILPGAMRRLAPTFVSRRVRLG